MNHVISTTASSLECRVPSTYRRFPDARHRLPLAPSSSARYNTPTEPKIPPHLRREQTHKDDIENNIVATAVRTQQANEELIKAERHQRAGRTRLCVVMSVLLIAVIIIIVTLKN